jgi:hypothetical protein
MGKLELEARDETAGIVEEGMHIFVLEEETREAFWSGRF